MLGLNREIHRGTQQRHFTQQNSMTSACTHSLGMTKPLLIMMSPLWSPSLGQVVCLGMDKLPFSGRQLPAGPRVASSAVVEGTSISLFIPL